MVAPKGSAEGQRGCRPIAALPLLLLLLAAGMAAPGAHALSTQGTTILDENGNPLLLKGMSWFGFNNGANMVDGLWNPSDGFIYDFATIIYRWQLLGFNAIRLPFSMAALYSSSAPSSKLSTSCSLPTFTQIAYSVVDPNATVASGLTFPAAPAWPTHSANTCNEYLPENTTLSRFIWVVQYLAKSGFYVIIDDHTEDPTVVSSKTQFISYWVDIVTRVSADPTAAKRLIVDILNEPDARGWGWDTMGPLYLSVMDAVYPVNNQVLFLVEGCGQGGFGANWGDGFQTSGVSPNSPQDPNPFFTALFSKPYLSHLALSPHVYGPSVTYASSNYYGAGLWNRLSSSFGHLTKAGYTVAGVTRTFPVVIGEFGSKFQNAGDLQFLPDFAAYLLNTGAAADGLHNPIGNFVWWDWNDNSGDTGGLIDSSWFNLIWVKVRYLNRLGLTPWYNHTGPTSSPTPAPSPRPSPVPSPVRSPSPHSPLPSPIPSPVRSPSPHSPALSPIPSPIRSPSPHSPLPSPVPSPVRSPSPHSPLRSPSPSPSPSPKTSPSPTPSSPRPGPSPSPGSTSCQARFSFSSNWTTTLGVTTSANIYVKALGSTPVPVPWTFTMSKPSYTGASGPWNIQTLSFASGTFTGQITQGWEALAAPNGGEINVGMTLSASTGTSSFLPTSFAVNGAACTITQ